MTDKEIVYNSLIPELSVSNIDISKKFYLDLGFKIRYERKENKFCFLQLEGNQIMIEENNDNWNTGKLEHPYGRGINLSMTVSNIEKMYEILKEKNIKLQAELDRAQGNNEYLEKLARERLGLIKEGEQQIITNNISE